MLSRWAIKLSCIEGWQQSFTLIQHKCRNANRRSCEYLHDTMCLHKCTC